MEENINNIKNLLQNVSIIQEKYDEIAKITGENFNIFSVMNMEYDEVYTHSAIIGELLNPNGSHGQGSIFLDLFVDEINKSFNSDEDKIELDHFGTLVNDKICERVISQSNDWENVVGGRIDIIIEDSKQIIIIENKPGWQDQPYQLIRYNKYAETKVSKKAFLFYLTLDGRPLKKEEEFYVINGINIEGYNFKYNEINKYVKFKDDNIDNDNIHHCLYYPISFKYHIKDWIEKCLEKTHSLPIIRETLAQYLHLIKKLTNQSTNYKMSEEIIKLIAYSAESVKASKLIIENYENALNTLKSKVVNTFIEILIKNGFKEEDIEIKRTTQGMSCFFVILKTFDLKENGFCDLGINVELDIDHYFFCVIKKNEYRVPNNTKSEFNEIREYLNGRVSGLTSNEWKIGFSDHFKIGINTDEYYLPSINNENSFNELAKILLNYKKLLTQ